MKASLTTLCISFFLLLPGYARAQFAGGAGTSGDPYQVATAAQLDSVRHHLSAYFIQTADIDLDVAPYNTGKGWLPIEDNTNTFTGSFDGDGHTITGLFIDRSSALEIGLFGVIGSAASLKNVGLLEVNITGGNATGNEVTGGLVARNAGGTVTGSYAIGTVSGGYRTGGLVGYNAGSGTVSQSYAAVTVSGIIAVGGLVGDNAGGGTVSQSYATGAVFGSHTIGGLVGENLDSGTLTDNYATGAVSGSGNYIGGLVGYNYSTITNSYATGTVSGNGGFYGGLVGDNEGPVTNGYWNTETAGQNNGVGFGFTSSITGLTTARMRQQNSFSGFDFTSGTPIWGIDVGDHYSYPYLQANEQSPHPGVISVFAGGDGTPGDPYQVATAAQLDSVRYHLGTYFIQTADINLNNAPYNTGSGWQPIGDGSNRFTGHYNGDGHIIAGLFINRPSTDAIGLFGATDAGSNLSMVGLKGVTITGHEYTGGLVGYDSGGTITNSYAVGSVSGNGDNTGGLVGFNATGSTIMSSYTSGFVSGNNNTGGMTGENDGSIINSYATGSVFGSGITGGLVGQNASTVTNSYAAGSVSGSGTTGGLVGQNAKGSAATNSYWDTQTTGQPSSAGGTGLTTVKMRQQTNFSGFNFSGTWDIDEGDPYSYPYLQANEQSPHPGVQSGFAGGTGTSADPYQVATPSQLDSVRYHLDAYFIQTADINLSEATGESSGAFWNSGSGWQPIGVDDSNQFTGSYNGGGYTISGLFINRSADYTGLFGFAGSGASIKKVGLVEVNISGGLYTGGLMGDNNGTITGSYATGSVSGSGIIGGLVGGNFSIATGNYAAGSVSGNSLIGGLVGLNVGTVSQSYATGSVLGNGDFTGGLGGDNYGTVTNSYATGIVSGSGSAGGLVGVNENNAMITNSYWDTETTGQNNSVNGTGLTTVKMQQQDSFTGFDFGATWGISEGYTFPYLLGTTHRVVSASISGDEGWRMLASPLDSTSYATLLDTLYTQGYPGSDAPTGAVNVYTWNEAAQTFQAPDSAGAIPGGGFIVYVFDDQNFDGTADGFPKTLLAEGEEDTATVTMPLSYTNTGIPDSVGFNLVGNPYGHPIDWDASGWTKTNLNAPFYVWSDSASGGAGAYLSWNGSTGTLPDGKIAPWQGFWVQANAASPVLGFSPDVQSTGGVLYGRPGTSTNKPQTVPQIRFVLKQDNSSADKVSTLQSQAIVMFTRGASTGPDPLDAWKLASLNTTYLSLFTTTPGGLALDINALPVFKDSLQTSALETDMDFKGSDVGGAYSLSWTPKALPSGWAATLTDTYTGKSIKLNQAGHYTFKVDGGDLAQTSKVSKILEVSHAALSQPPAGVLPTVVEGQTHNARFTLHIAPAAKPAAQDIPRAISVSPGYPNPFSSTCSITIGLPKQAHVRIVVYDILGRRVITLMDATQPAGYHTVSMKAANMASGVYLCRVQIGNKIQTVKITHIK